VNHAALLYFLHLQATYIRHIPDIFLRALLLPPAPWEFFNHYKNDLQRHARIPSGVEAADL